MNFEQRLNQLIDNFTGEILEAVRQSSLKELMELMELSSPSAAPAVDAGTKAKKKGSGRPKKVVRPVPAPAPVEAVPQPVPVSEPVVEAEPAEVPVVETEPAPKPMSPPPPPVPFYKRAEAERFEKAVMEFVTLNPGTDAGAVAMRLGVPMAKAQNALDEFAFSGKLKMTSGNHGRQYRVSEGE